MHKIPKALHICLTTVSQPSSISSTAFFCHLFFPGQRNSEGPTYSRFPPSLHHLRCKADGDEQSVTPPRQTIKYQRLSTSRRAFAHPAMTAQKLRGLLIPCKDLEESFKLELSDHPPESVRQVCVPCLPPCWNHASHYWRGIHWIGAIPWVTQTSLEEHFSTMLRA